jgi:hypothetical protein
VRAGRSEWKWDPSVTKWFIIQALAITSLREPDLHRILAPAYENNCTTTVPPLLRAQNFHSAYAFDEVLA